MNTIVGNILKALPPGGLVMALPAHGFISEHYRFYKDFPGNVQDVKVCHSEGQIKEYLQKALDRKDHVHMLVRLNQLYTGEDLHAGLLTTTFFYEGNQYTIISDSSAKSWQYFKNGVVCLKSDQEPFAVPRCVTHFHKHFNRWLRGVSVSELMAA